MFACNFFSIFEYFCFCGSRSVQCSAAQLMKYSHWSKTFSGNFWKLRRPIKMFKYSCSVQQSIFLELNKIFEVMIRSPWQAWNLKIYISLQRTFFVFVFRETFFVTRFLSKSMHSLFMIRRISGENSSLTHFGPADCL